MNKIASKINHFINEGLLVSPWLAGMGKRSRFDDDIYEYLDGQAQSISELQWTESIQTETFGENVPVPDRIPRTALYEIAASTAVWIAHEETGTPIVTFDFADRALQQIHVFIKKHGLGTLVEVYSIATRFENYQALDYYKEMSEREFILGNLHRPWIDYSLQDELIFGVLIGNLKIRLSNGNRVVSLTEKGYLSLKEMTDILIQSGYLEQRMHHLHVSRFNSAIVFDEIIHKIAPDWIPQRTEFIEWLGIKPGMNVLEIGCGDGLLTFDSGLSDRIGPMGRLTALDPSKGMLVRTQRKLMQNPRPWVQLMQATVEDLPYADESFDAVIGAAFLHLTDMPKALKEMKRVTRKGGIVGSFNMLPFGMDTPFFVDWLSPLLDLASKSNRKEPKTYLVSKSEIEKEFCQTGLVIENTKDLTSRALYWWPKENINILIRGLGWAQEELSTIPWAAREEMIKFLEDRGETISQKYTQEERILQFPMQMIKAVVK